MAGELWLGYFQIGKETTAGTTVAATRRMYYGIDDSSFAREREPRAHRFATGSRDTVRAFTLGPQVVSGSVKQMMSADEIIELLLMTISGGVTPTGTGTTKLWTFKPGATLDAATIEWYDGARGWDIGGCHGNSLNIAGSANGPNEVTAEIYGLNMAIATPTGSLAQRVPAFIEGWETALYVDAFLGTAGTTAVAGTLINWDVSIENGLGRKYFAANTTGQGATAIGELSVKASLTFEASAAAAATEFANWDAATKRLVRLSFGNNAVVDGTDKSFVTVDIPGAWDAVDLGGTDEGTRTYELSLQYVYDTTNAFGLQIRCQNARATAY